MSTQSTTQKYLADILVAVNKLNERSGSTIKSIVHYIRQNRIKNSNLCSDILKQQIKRNVQSAVQLKLLRCVNGKYRLLEDIRSGGQIGKYRAARHGRGKHNKSNSPHRRKSRRRSGSRRNRSGSRRRRGGSHRRSKSSPQKRPSATPQNKAQNEEQKASENAADDADEQINNNSNGMSEM